MPEEALFPEPARKIEEIDKAEVNRLGRLVVLSLTGFLVAGWFLSRAYVMTLFLLGGMAEVVFEMALEREMIASRLPLAAYPCVCRSVDGLAGAGHVYPAARRTTSTHMMTADSRSRSSMKIAHVVDSHGDRWRRDARVADVPSAAGAGT